MRPIFLLRWFSIRCGVLSCRTFGEMSSVEEQYDLCRELCRELSQDLQKEGLKVGYHCIPLHKALKHKQGSSVRTQGKYLVGYVKYSYR